MTNDVEARELLAIKRRIAAMRQTLGMSRLQARCVDRDGEWSASSLFNDIEAALQPADPVAGGDCWRPIETHAGHCSPVLVCRDTPTETNRATSAFLDATGVWRVLNSEGGMCPLPFKPTHWMRQPDQPSLAAHHHAPARDGALREDEWRFGDSDGAGAWAVSPAGITVSEHMIEGLISLAEKVRATGYSRREGGDPWEGETEVQQPEPGIFANNVIPVLRSYAMLLARHQDAVFVTPETTGECLRHLSPKPCKFCAALKPCKFCAALATNPTLFGKGGGE